MQEFFGLALLLSFVVLAVIRTLALNRQGINAMEFGKKDRKDFLIPPFVFFYFYLVIANAFNLPTIPNQELFHNEVVSWFGVAVFLVGVMLFGWALFSFKKSFRIGLVENVSEGLITTGALAVSRNPIYLAFTLGLVGQFLVFCSWILFFCILGGFWLFRRQVLKEEIFLREQYGKEFIEYCKHVPRWI